MAMVTSTNRFMGTITKIIEHNETVVERPADFVIVVKRQYTHLYIYTNEKPDFNKFPIGAYIRVERQYGNFKHHRYGVFSTWLDENLEIKIFRGAQ